MKRTIPLIAALVIGLVIAAGCLSPHENPATVPVTTSTSQVRAHYVIGVDGNFPPFTLKDSGGNFSGFDADAARWVADREGFDITFIAVPWDMIVPSLQSGKIDIIWSGLTITDEREAAVNFSVPYDTVNNSIAVRAGSGFTMQDLYRGRLRIGVEAGSSEADWVEKNFVLTGKIADANVSRYPDIVSLTAGLESGAVDASLIQEPSQKQEVLNKPLVIIGTIQPGDSYAVAVRKNDPVLLAKINNGLASLMKDPYWQQLKLKYGLE